MIEFKDFKLVNQTPFAHKLIKRKEYQDFLLIFNWSKENEFIYNASFVFDIDIDTEFTFVKVSGQTNYSVTTKEPNPFGLISDSEMTIKTKESLLLMLKHTLSLIYEYVASTGNDRIMFHTNEQLIQALRLIGVKQNPLNN